MREFLINENDSGQRLDKFISKLMPALPKSLLYKGLRKNCVKLNKKHVKDGSVFLKEGDVLSLYFKDEFFARHNNFKYVKPDIDIVYEDENIIVVNKEVGVLSHSDENGKGNTLIDMICSYLYDKKEYDPSSELTFRPSLCNRLDRNTGGLIIAAKNSAALREMNANIKNRCVRKFYTAIVCGQPQEIGDINTRLSREDKVTKVSENGVSALLSYKVVARKSEKSLVEIELHTGRTHQIRAQFSYIGHPLWGDTKYGGTGKEYRQSLYATKLLFNIEKGNFFDYLDGVEMVISSPLEKEF